MHGSTLEVDADGTASLRREIRDKRMKTAVKPTHRPGIVDGRRLLPMGENLEVVSGDHRVAVRCKCGCDLGDVEENWKVHTAVRNIGAEEAGPRCKLHEDLEMCGFLCPECGTLLSIDIKKKNEAFLWDARIPAETLLRL